MNGTSGDTATPPQIPEAPAPPRAPQTTGPASYGRPPAATAAATHPREKSPALACFLSCMPGLGQVYVGYYQRGFVHALVVASLITLLASNRTGALTPLFGLFLAFFWLYNIIDAGRRAAFYNQAVAGQEVLAPPGDFETPGLRGSIAGGVTLIVVGLVLLLYTRFDVPLDWVEEWWPLAPVVFGAYLIFRAVQDRSGRSPE